MTKAEMIERYGIEWYEEQKRKAVESHRTKEFTEYCRNFHRNRYKDPEVRARRLAQNEANRKGKYVVGGRIDLVENYERAKNDNFEGWCLHHRIQLHPDGSTRYTKTSLLKLGLYYRRPPEELIWLTNEEHGRMHAAARNMQKNSSKC